MNFHLGGSYSVILMSEQPGAPYEDRTEDDGKVLIYEGHDIPHRKGGPDPKETDQPMTNPSGSLCQNGLFYQAAMKYKEEGIEEIVKVYEKIRSGIWTFNGFFILKDAWLEKIDNRNVFRFKLKLLKNQERVTVDEYRVLEHPRIIPSSVKREVWKRDQGMCVKCGRKDNLHFDHIIPYSKGGSSLVADNIQLLCARHNLEKRDKIQ
ncbi:HNH endonuclease [bacterium]|nr:HNH endonuclease [bacterium]